MWAKESRLTRSGQFAAVSREGTTYHGRLAVLKALPNGLDQTRYGFIVSRRVGKAVVRNRVKRLLRESTRQMAIQPGWDVVFIARPAAAEASYQDMKSTVRGLLIKGGLGGDPGG